MKLKKKKKKKKKKIFDFFLFFFWKKKSRVGPEIFGSVGEPETQLFFLALVYEWLHFFTSLFKCAYFCKDIQLRDPN